MDGCCSSSPASPLPPPVPNPTAIADLARLTAAPPPRGPIPVEAHPATQQQRSRCPCGRARRHLVQALLGPTGGIHSAVQPA
jgi:hypothetical protein